MKVLIPKNMGEISPKTEGGHVGSHGTFQTGISGMIIQVWLEEYDFRSLESSCRSLESSWRFYNRIIYAYDWPGLYDVIIDFPNAK